MGIDNQPGYFILFVWDRRFIEKTGKRQIRQRHLRRYSLRRIRSGDFGQYIACAPWRRLGEQYPQIRKDVTGTAEGCGKAHRENLRKR